MHFADALIRHNLQINIEANNIDFSGSLNQSTKKNADPEES